MKAFINCDTLINLIKKNTILTKRDNIPDYWQWFQTSDGVVTWDFVIKDKVLIDVEEDSIEQTLYYMKIKYLLESYQKAVEEYLKTSHDVEELARLEGKVEATEAILELLV